MKKKKNITYNSIKIVSDPFPPLHNVYYEQMQAQQEETLSKIPHNENCIWERFLHKKNHNKHICRYI